MSRSAEDFDHFIDGGNVSTARRAARKLASLMPVTLVVAAGRLGKAIGPRNLPWASSLSFARVALADAKRARGNYRGAIKQYEAALREVETSDERWPLRRKQQWQFQLERCYDLIGQRRVDDPLFACVVEPPRQPTLASHGAPNTFAAHLTYMGLSINGVVGSKADSVHLYLNGLLLRTVNVSREGRKPKFNLTIKRSTLELLPRESRLEARTPDGLSLSAPGGAAHLDLTIPHGNGGLIKIIADGGALSKKGTIKLSAAEVRTRQDRDLEIYSQVREFFADHLGRPIFLMYGTLLGYHRDGDLIPHDDDFDAGYVSDQTDPVSVKEETKDIIVELVRAGFTISFNRSGRLFRIQLDRDATDGCHVDVHPMWFQDGNVWVHNVVSLPATREDFLPAVEGKLRGSIVSAPCDPEVFLRGNYGPGWKVPDPGFRYYNSATDPSVQRNLNKALIGVSEYRELAEQIQSEVGDSPAAGRFISLGSQDLYPLDKFLV